MEVDAFCCCPALPGFMGHRSVGRGMKQDGDITHLNILSFLFLGPKFYFPYFRSNLTYLIKVTISCEKPKEGREIASRL